MRTRLKKTNLPVPDGASSTGAAGLQTCAAATAGDGVMSGRNRG